MSDIRWEDHFLPGEKLLWQGAPVAGVHSWRALIYMTVFGIPFLVAGLGLTFGGLWAATSAAGWAQLGYALLAVVIGLPFLVIGLYLVAGQWVAALRAPDRIRYALSTRAAYIAQRYWGRKFAIYPITASSPLTLDCGRRADTVWFHSHDERDSEGIGTVRAGFENIDQGAHVMRLLRQVQDSHVQFGLTETTRVTG